MDWIYVIAPAVGAFFGWLVGCMMNERALIGSANWIPTYLVLGALWGIARAAAYRGVFKKEDREKGEFLTETKAYKKAHSAKRVCGSERKDTGKADEPSDQRQGRQG